MDQQLSEEQGYRETVMGVMSYIGWHKLLEIDSASFSTHDNPFAGPRSQSSGKVKLPVDKWLCHKMDKLNFTFSEINNIVM